MPTLFFADLVREHCDEGGTGPLLPAGALPGHRSFADAVPAETDFHYAIAGIAFAGEWEVGTGRIGGDGRLVRDAVAASSAGGAVVDFTPGLKTIALTVGASWFAASDAAQGTMATALTAKQPLSTIHDSAATGAASDLMTVRRGEGWVNIALSALVFRDSDGTMAASAPVACVAGSAGAPGIAFAGDANSGLFSPAADTIALTTAGAERMRLTATGSLSIGTIAAPADLTVGGVSGGANRSVQLGSAGQTRMRFETDAANGLGCIIATNDSSTGSLVFKTGASASEALRIDGLGNTRPGSDNSKTLGAAAARWSVVYAGSGAINTSDAREKQWRGAPSDGELRAARRIADELGFFQWLTAIADKGADGARHHFGVRAQAVWAIMADEGLVDPIAADGRPGAAPYAFLCWDEWAEEDGARMRFGVRPDQLALFLVAGQAARIAALEAAA